MASAGDCLSEKGQDPGTGSGAWEERCVSLLLVRWTCYLCESAVFGFLQIARTNRLTARPQRSSFSLYF